MLVCVGDARADTPFVGDAWRFGTPEGGVKLRYCIDARDPDWRIAQRIAAAIAGRLLLTGDEYLIGADPNSVSLAGDELDSIYRLLRQHCDVFLGFKLVADSYPAWLTITRAYYRSAYVYVVASPGWGALGEMPVSRAIGATIGTAGDLRLSQYLLALPAARRWDKFPMGSDEAALRAVSGGDTGAALVWAPALWALRHDDAAIAALREMPPAPLPVSTADVGAILLSRQAFLRHSVDDAIASLTADGSIAAILREAAFPAETVP